MPASTKPVSAGGGVGEHGPGDAERRSGVPSGGVEVGGPFPQTQASDGGLSPTATPGRGVPALPTAGSPWGRAAVVVQRA